MSDPRHEATGSRRAPPTEPRLTPQQQVRGKIDCLLYFTRRALDGLAVDADHQPNWTYVAGQLNAAGHFANAAEELAQVAALADDVAADNAPSANASIAPDGVLPFPPEGPYEGRAS